ncbi:MAG: PQQ-binding-like beta-propeller repeat protein [Acidobacteria bacterium]|nr:PQQ-binding-like beta-propeller repeat protein [Acidobacteriota bacterium]
MKNQAVVSRFFNYVFLALAGLSAIFGPGCSQGSPEDQAAAILEKSGIRGGVIVHLFCGDGVLTEKLGAGGSFLVQGLDPDAENVRKARETIAQNRQYGPIAVDRLTENRLPFTDNMINLIVAEDLGNIPGEEAIRVLAPEGVLMTKGFWGWTKRVKPRPAEMDEWNQYLYDAGNNPVSRDSTISPIKHYQWVGSPRWGRHHDTTASMSAMVSARGRIFYILDEGPTESIQLPDENHLIARDAFNGTVLWKLPIPEWQDHLFSLKSGPAYLPRRLVAVGDRVYVTLGINAPVSELDAATGKILRTFPDTEETSEIVLSDNALFLVIGRPEKKTDPFVPKDTYVWANADQARSEWAWSREPGQIMALDMPSGRPRWTKEYPVGPLSLSADSGSVYFYDGSKLVSLDRETGGENWRSEPIQTRTIDTAYAPRLVVSDGVLVFSIGSLQAGGFAEGTMMAFSAEDGKKIWEAPQPFSGHYSPEDIFVIDGMVWTGNIGLTSEVNPEESGEFIGRDLHTGEKIAEFPCDQDIYWFHQRCYPSKATEKYIIPSRTGIEFVDLKQQHWEINHYTRGGCLYGIMPGNGLVYTPPHACACYMEAKLNGMGALGGSLAEEPDLEAESSQNRLEKGPAYDAAIADNSGDGDWPTYRNDSRRSGHTPTAVAPAVGPEWKLALGGRLSSPVVAGGRLYVAQVDAHTIYAMDSGAGDVLWKYTAGGRVDSPPTIYKGRVLFGSADGYVYCLNSADGRLIWRFRAAPMNRRMMAFEQLESVWPVHGSVLAENGRVYCVAGRSAFLDGGMRLLILEPETGEKLSETVIDEIDPNTGKNLHALVKKLDMPVGLPDILSSDGKYIYMRSQQFDLQGNRTFVGVRDVREQSGEGAHVFSPIGFLDDSQFSRSYMMYGKSVLGGWGGWEIMAKTTPAGRLIAVDDDTVYGFGRKPEFYSESIVLEYQLYAAKQSGDPGSIEKITSTIPRPGAAISDSMFNYAGDWKLRQGLPGDEQTAVRFKWRIDKPPLQARAMVLAGKTLFAAGPPDIVDEEENFFILDDGEVLAKLAEQSELLRGREGGLMWAVSAENGKKLSEYRLDSLPVWDGMIAAGGKLYMTTINGDVACWSGKGE